jgi:flagellar FliL protein
MSTAATETDTDAAVEPSADAKPRLDKRKLLLVGGPLLLAGTGAGLWFSGILPRLLGLSHPAPKVADTRPAAPVFIDLPEMVANLNSNPRRPSYVKVVARLELGAPEDVDRVKAAMPRLQDLFQTYLREMHPEELRGAAGTYRLREELIGRATIAAAPAQVKDVLFTELLIQ